MVVYPREKEGIKYVQSHHLMGETPGRIIFRRVQCWLMWWYTTLNVSPCGVGR